jgi:tRNA-dihydrouridine synthase
MAEDVGVDAITVHPRTRSQQFTGRAPWQIIRDVVEAVRIPVTGNGDVKSMADARAMLAETGCAHVMIGRGAVGSPWVFNENFDSWSPREQWAYRERTIRRHCDLMRTHYADVDARVGHTQMRKQLAWYSEGLPHSAGVRRRIFETKTIDEAETTFWELWERASGMLATGDWEPSRRRELATV